MKILRKAVLGAAVAALISCGGSAAWAQTSQPGAPAGQAPPQGMMGYGMPMMGPGMMMGHGMMGYGMPMMGPGMMGYGTPMMPGGVGPMMGMMPGQHVEGRIAFLRTELGITQAQAPVWDTFAEALRASARAMVDMHGQMMPMMQQGPQAMPLAQRLELQERMMTLHLEALRRVRSAAGPLYAALDERQKRVADQLMVGMM